MGSFRRAPSPPSDVPIVFLTPDAEYAKYFVTIALKAIAWSGDPAQWPACAESLRGTHVVIWPRFRGRTWRKGRVTVLSSGPRNFDTTAWARACVTLLAGVAAAVDYTPEKSPQKKAS